MSKDIPVKDGHIFCGWSTSVGGSVKYQPGDIYSADQDLILVAVWQKEPEPIPGYSCGDIDNNGTINLKDVTQLQNIWQAGTWKLQRNIVMSMQMVKLT